jgi:omega-amidase
MSSTLRLSLIQSRLHWENKEANLNMFEEKIRSIASPTEIVILPEMFSTGFSMNPEKLAEKMDGKTVTWMRRIASERKLILTGSVIIEEDGNYFNRLIWMLPTGQYGYYDKRHRFAFAGEDEEYTAGNKRLIASVNGWRILLLVCYDLRFPVWSRQSTEKTNGQALEYDLLIYVANWPERRNHAWKTLLQARAIENQSFVAGVNRVGTDGKGINYSGDSMVIDPLGNVMYQKENDEDIYTVALQRSELEAVRQKYPFWRDADSFKIITEE